MIFQIKKIKDAFHELVECSKIISKVGKYVRWADIIDLLEIL